MAPADFYTIYDVGSLISSSVTGTGVTIAVAGQADISLSDVAAFRTAAGLTSNVPTVTLYGSDPGSSVAGDVIEAEMDVEWAGAVAPGASIAVPRNMRYSFRTSGPFRYLDYRADVSTAVVKPGSEPVLETVANLGRFSA